ncbi:hypothetical protein BB8028_0002g15180 [Beauveria bassiana]|uniref:Uncharacterized protein n=1 Tax=Beauveria bassiana TaxID=176275 RepID=A0A2S7Y4Z9_BEABA|nr:hypothetical protein BB8028_0002g15180 [Beauveria bassiana]
MWDRRKATAGATAQRAKAGATAEATGSRRRPPPGTDQAVFSGTLKDPQQSSVASSTSKSLFRSRHGLAAASASAVSADKAYSFSSPHSQLNLDLEYSLSALALTTDVTHKYRILNGKAVPQSLYPEDPYTSRLDYSSSSASSPELKPPPRNPRRLQQLRYQTVFAPTHSSSVYSADDSDPDDDASPTTIRRGAAALEMAQPLAIEPVSPPSSPDITAWRTAPHAGTVSPIDEDSDASLDDFVRAVKGETRQLTPPSEPLRDSQIPLTHRNLPALPRPGPYHAPGSDRAPAYQRPPSQRKPVADQNTQWHPQPQLQGNPAGLVPQHPQQTFIPQRDSSSGMRTRHADTRAMPLDARPPWQGASGREQQVAPMRDDSSVAALSLPVKGGKRNTAKGDGHFRTRLSHIGNPRTDGATGPGAAMRKLLSPRRHKKANSLATQSPRAQYNMDASQYDPNPYPSPPHHDQHRMVSASPPPRHSPGQSITIKRKPPPGVHVDKISNNAHPLISAHVDRNSNHAHPLASSPVYENNVPKPPTPESPSAPHQRGDAWAQPASRFSMTRYATTVGGVTSIDSSPAIGMQSPTSSLSPSDETLSRPEHLRSISDAPFAIRSALNSRPDSTASNNTLSTSAVPGSGAAVSTKPRRSSLSSMSKPLPPAPPEVSASDRVTHLTAQLDSLANRRLNIDRCIKQMTEQMPIDHLLNSDEVLRRRELERQRIDGLKAELAEIQREQHELGLMLHRAHKRQNKEAVYEPTSLWVRRVAS